jgi:iron complex outermembrane receptor protein
VRVSFEYRVNELRALNGYPGQTRYHVLAGSGMWESRLNDVITFTLAGRLDHLKLEQEGEVNQPTIFTKEDFNRTINAWSFNSALLFKLSEASSLRIAGGRGIQVPSLISFGSRLAYPIPGRSLVIVSAGNPAIDPTRIWSGEIGLIQALDQKGSRFELTAFYNRTDDVISIGAPQTPPRAKPPAYPFILAISDNVGIFHAYGIEASLTGRFAQRWPWSLNYTWTKADQHIVGNTGSLFKRPLALDSATPEHKVKAQLSYEQGAWLATVAARYTSNVSQLVGSGPTRVGPLVLVDINASLALDAKLAFKASDRLTFTIAGENLTDAAGVDLSPAPAERRLRAGVQVRF